MNDAKTLVSSWTFWFGFLQILLAAVGYLGQIMDEQAALALFITGWTSIGLRLKTTKPVGGIL